MLLFLVSSCSEEPCPPFFTSDPSNAEFHQLLDPPLILEEIRASFGTIEYDSFRLDRDLDGVDDLQFTRISDATGSTTDELHNVLLTRYTRTFIKPLDAPIEIAGYGYRLAQFGPDSSTGIIQLVEAPSSSSLGWEELNRDDWNGNGLKVYSECVRRYEVSGSYQSADLSGTYFGTDNFMLVRKSGPTRFDRFWLRMDDLNVYEIISEPGGCFGE